ncbi:MAG: hypothetical protein HKN87_05710 [Saprospiraceae bacterium]|nr:hypothetical protein [Saprospiraceae bacterium]
MYTAGAQLFCAQDKAQVREYSSAIGVVLQRNTGAKEPTKLYRYFSDIALTEKNEKIAKRAIFDLVIFRSRLTSQAIRGGHGERF